MDRMRACGVCDPGSIPGEGTARKKPTAWLCPGSEELFVIYKELLVLNKSKRYTVLVEKDALVRAPVI